MSGVDLLDKALHGEAGGLPDRLWDSEEGFWMVRQDDGFWATPDGRYAAGCFVMSGLGTRFVREADHVAA